MTEAERVATQRMREKTAYLHPDGLAPKAGKEETSHGTPAPETAVTGTKVIPMPSDSDNVAGMPREHRVHTQPGDPGTPAPEGQAVGKDVPDPK